MRRVILHSIDKANLKCTILIFEQIINLHNASLLLIFYLDPINIFVLCISGYENKNQFKTNFVSPSVLHGNGFQSPESNDIIYNFASGFTYRNGHFFTKKTT